MKSTEIEPSGGLVLECGRCGKNLVLLGSEEDWCLEGPTSFECGGCGEELILDDRLGDKELTMRKVGVPPGGASGGP